MKKKSLQARNSEPDEFSLGYMETLLDLGPSGKVKVATDLEDPLVEQQMHLEACENAVRLFKAAREAIPPQTIQSTPVNLQECSLSVEEAVRGFEAEQLRKGAWTARTAKGFRDYLQVFIELVGGDTPVNAIDRAQMRLINEQLHKLPPNMRKAKAFKHLSTREIVALDHGMHMSPTTVNKYVVNVGAMMKWCKSNDYTTVDFTDVLKLLVKRGAANPRLPFNDSMLKKIFDPNTYPKPRTAWQYFLPLLGLYTGCRLNELCQLYKDDVSEVEGIYCIRVTDARDDQSLKGDRSAKRFIPVHSDLIKLGFREFVEGIRTARLWPQLPFIEGEGYKVKVSKWFSRQHLVKTGAKADGLSFHSLRHNFGTAVANAKDIQRADELSGRVPSTASSGGKSYYHGMTIKEKKEVIELISFPMPLLTHVKK